MDEMDQVETFGETHRLTQTVIGCAMRVSNTLGVGFLEKVYEGALSVELAREGLIFERQKQLTVFYEGIEVGEFFADIVVENRLILELKAAKAIEDAHQSQVLNYLRATELRVALILNFGTPKLGIKRLVW